MLALHFPSRVGGGIELTLGGTCPRTTRAYTIRSMRTDARLPTMHQHPPPGAPAHPSQTCTTVDACILNGTGCFIAPIARVCTLHLCTEPLR